jgi:DNA adenine methylase
MTAMNTKVTALANWFGSNRTLAYTVGRQLGKCEWVGVPFCGGCCELPYIKTRSGIASDLHRHLVNLARVIREPESKSLLVRRLDETLFHPDELVRAQKVCIERDRVIEKGLFGSAQAVADSWNEDTPSVEWAWAYFVSSWMTPGGRSGTKGEFGQSLSFRWTASGGDSCTRFRSAVESLDGWSQAMQPWNFVCMDAFEFLAACKDKPGHGIYLDAPWPEDGDGYKHPFTVQHQRKLASVAREFTQARVVVRFGDHPLIRELYPESHWTWVHQTSRAQSNDDVREVLLLNGRSYMEAAA